jgi:hypothetical protein
MVNFEHTSTPSLVIGAPAVSASDNESDVNVARWGSRCTVCGWVP